jgi:hypothetical protein
MSPEKHSQDAEAGSGQRVKTPKWRYVYFLLAAFDLVTVSAGLYLNHRIMGIYRASVEVNRVWAERVSAYSHLGELAGDVDAPGNDVFDTRDVRKEFIRMEAAVKAFDLDLEQRRLEPQAALDPNVSGPLLTLLDAITVAKTQMTEEAARIFDYFLEGRPTWRASVWRRWTQLRLPERGAARASARGRRDPGGQLHETDAAA